VNYIITSEDTHAEEAIHKEAEWINRLGAEKGHEVASLISRDGNRVLGTWEGSEHRTNIPGAEYLDATKGVPSGSIDFIHCHLSGALFGDQDMITMCEVEQIGRMMVSLPNDDVFYLTVGIGRCIDPDTITYTFDYHYFRYEREEKTKPGVDELLPEQQADVIIKVVDKMADLFGWKWGKA